MAKGPMFQAESPVLDLDDGGPGVFLKPEEVFPERDANIVGCYVTVVTAGGRRIDGMVRAFRGWRQTDRLPWDGRRAPFVFEIDGERWAIDLRRVVYDLPFAVRLDQFVKRDHPGTMTAADFRSFVTVREGANEQPVQIFMNTPLRKDGYVLFQTSWGPQHNGRPAGGPPWFSTFEVANNPSDKWPEIACWVIAAGLVLHFLHKLWRFLNSSTREALVS
jgi:hypothetical protein